MKTQKQKVIIPNDLHGDKEVTAYCADGLGVYKLHHTWVCIHTESGRTFGLGRGGDRDTRKGAFAVMAALLKLPIEWTKKHEEISQQMQANKNEIMQAIRVDSAS